jgi:hypothetical protein
MEMFSAQGNSEWDEVFNGERDRFITDLSDGCSSGFPPF